MTGFLEKILDGLFPAHAGVILHPYCRCTIIARFAWEDDGDEDGQTPSKDDPGTQKTIEGWLKEVEAQDKAKADKVRSNPTKANAQAAADAQDKAMKEAEQRQQTAIGLQRRSIQQGKPTKTEKNSPEISNREAQSNMSKVAKRSANRATGERNADRTTTTQEGAMREIAQEIKEEYQARRTEEEKRLIRELVESGRKVTPKDIIYIDKAEAGGIIWMETGTEGAGLIHILKHQKELKVRGIETKEIPRVTAEIIKRGEIVSGTKSKNGKEGLLLRYSEKLYIISVGDNGYIVGLYPVREGERYEKTGYDAGHNRAVALGLR